MHIRSSFWMAGRGVDDRSDLGGAAPSSQQLNYLARLREEVESDEGSSADEGAAARGDWSGLGRSASWRRVQRP